MILWLQFLLSAGLVVISGIKLSQCAEVISRKSKLGALWVGSILLSLGTSLPELVAGMSSGFLGFPDLAVGNVLGSNIFNIAVIALIDLFDGKHSILRKVRLGHILSASYGMLLSAIVAVSIFVQSPYSIGWVGLDTVLIAITYLFGLRMISRYEKREPQQHPVILADDVYEPEREYNEPLNISLSNAYIGFAISALVIGSAGTLLTISSEQVAIVTGLGSSFVGSTLLAFATSLPEVVACLTAVRAGAFDLAIGNVLGSNIFNMVILIFSDLAYFNGPILSAVTNTHILTALVGLIMSTVVVIGLFYRSTKSYFKLGPDSVFIVLIYFTFTYLLYLSR